MAHYRHCAEAQLVKRHRDLRQHIVLERGEVTIERGRQRECGISGVCMGRGGEREKGEKGEENKRIRVL